MEKRTIIVCASALFLITVSLLDAQSGHTSCNLFPTVEERAREAAIVVVATVGDLADTTVSEQGVFFGLFPPEAHLQYVVQHVFRGTAIPDTLILPFWGVYATFSQGNFWGWPCQSMYMSRGEVAVLYIDGLQGCKPLQFSESQDIFQLGRSQWDSSLLQTDRVLVRVQKALAGPFCAQNTLPTVEERAREAAIVAVATVGDLTDAAADEIGFFDGTAHVQFGVQAILKGTAIPDTLTLPFEGQYTTFVRGDYRGWVPGINCRPDVSREEWVLLFLDGATDRNLRFENLFHLGYYITRRDPGLLQGDGVLARVQHVLAEPSNIEGQGSWGVLKQRFRRYRG